jgi:uncharacterized protein (DUF2237 family)
VPAKRSLKMDIDDSVNVLGEPLEECGNSPVTGFFRDGKCNTCEQDSGLHTVCVVATPEFLEYSRNNGNDLSTPIPEFGFEGLKPGDTWCVCAARWLQASKDGAAPKVYLTRTHQRTLEVVPFETLKQFAADLN